MNSLAVETIPSSGSCIDIEECGNGFLVDIEDDLERIKDVACSLGDQIHALLAFYSSCLL